MAFSYLAGVLKGDGYIDKRQGHSPRFGVQTTSIKFADNIVDSAKKAGFNPTERKYHRHMAWRGYEWDCDYYFVRFVMSERCVAVLENFEPKTNSEKREFIKGFFQSEGSISVKKYPDRTCFCISIANSKIELLKKVQKFVQDFGIKMNLYTDKMHRSEKILRSRLVVQTKDGFKRFIAIFGDKEGHIA